MHSELLDTFVYATSEKLEQAAAVTPTSAHCSDGISSFPHTSENSNGVHSATVGQLGDAAASGGAALSNRVSTSSVLAHY